ncbi:mCG145080, partial [Mus musculus]
AAGPTGVTGWKVRWFGCCEECCMTINMFTVDLPQDQSLSLWMLQPWHRSAVSNSQKPRARQVTANVQKMSCTPESF